MSELSRAWFRRRLKTLLCSNCGVEFKQKVPFQKKCPACFNTVPPENPAVKRAIDDFYEFSNRSKIYLPYISEFNFSLFYHGATVPGPRRHKQGRRKAFAPHLATLRKYFEEGRIVPIDDKLYWLKEPLKPLCPIAHIYCRGTILPNSCPRSLGECTLGWHMMLKRRGIKLTPENSVVIADKRRPLYGRERCFKTKNSVPSGHENPRARQAARFLPGNNLKV